MNQVMQRVEADLAISISDLKKNPGLAFEAAQSQAVAVLNHNKVVGYVISPVAWEGMLEALDDLSIIGKLEKTRNEPRIEVTLDDLSGPIRGKRAPKLEQAGGNRSGAVRKSASTTRRKPARTGSAVTRST